ncbi:MAG: phosphogluconate dehydratase [Reinekea sp.]|nr:phosphogluconate dehydratase [Reinekea sp.]
MHTIIERLTQDILARSTKRRQAYLARMQAQADKGISRGNLSCSNLAHAVAPFAASEKQSLLDTQRANIGIVTAYNDMLSAHQPYQHYPEQIRQLLFAHGHSAQVAGGVPAMCDGVTQGQDGMEMSLFSRDLIAMATALSLSHNTFDGTLLLGICDKIAPGQLIGALSFGHLPTAFVPSGPMGTGVSNSEKARVRQEFAAGRAGKTELLNMECGAYHSAGTCTFYGTANTNQLVFEAMGLMLPGSAFVPPNSELRQKLTDKISLYLTTITRQGAQYRPLSQVMDEKAIVNGLVALLASGGSTNHTLHLLAVAQAAGFTVTWEDIDTLSNAVPLIVNIYPNGPDDINEFQASGGVPAFLTRLHELDLLHMDATPMYGTMHDYLSIPSLDTHGELVYTPAKVPDTSVVIARSASPFSTNGGIKVMHGHLGKGIMKVSALAPENKIVRAPARVFATQDEVQTAFERGELNRDVVVVLRFNGPAMNGMPELHKLMPILGKLMSDGHKVALVTDGRLSGASGKVPAVIHVTPEAKTGGAIAKIQDEDVVELNGETGELQVFADLDNRPCAPTPELNYHEGLGRELFQMFRNQVSSADTGASVFFQGGDE